MKYMIMMFGDQATMMETRSMDWIKQMIEFMKQIDVDLRESGELVAAEGLADASQAKTVSIKNGIPVATDGPFAESKESLAGYWILDVENEARAIEFAQHVVAFTEGPIEVRQVMDAPPEFCGDASAALLADRTGKMPALEHRTSSPVGMTLESPGLTSVRARRTGGWGMPLENKNAIV